MNSCMHLKLPAVAVEGELTRCPDCRSRFVYVQTDDTRPLYQWERCWLQTPQFLRRAA